MHIQMAYTDFLRKKKSQNTLIIIAIYHHKVSELPKVRQGPAGLTDKTKQKSW